MKSFVCITENKENTKQYREYYMKINRMDCVLCLSDLLTFRENEVNRNYMLLQFNYQILHVLICRLFLKSKRFLKLKTNTNYLKSL